MVRVRQFVWYTLLLAVSDAIRRCKVSETVSHHVVSFLLLLPLHRVKNLVKNTIFVKQS